MRVGIAGYGVVGKTRHRSIESNTSYQVTAISESSENARKSIPEGIDIYDDYKTLIASAELDVIFISLPNQFAAEARAFFLSRFPCSSCNIKMSPIIFLCKPRQEASSRYASCCTTTDVSHVCKITI